ncbi:MAG: hypothetical protein JOZ72_18300 [Alphaproteobacteria bacterium]|nr:hypothetical protein [Alphaproteobacteria bacterium]
MKNHVRAAACLAFALSLSACAVKPVALPDYQERAPDASFTITDARPEKDKTSEVLSYWATACDYGIYRIGDERTVPPKLVFLRRNLEDALGARLKGAALTVTRYRVHINSRAQLRNQLNGMYTGVVPAMLDAAGNGCTKDETSGGWFDASEVTTAFPPAIVEIEAAMAGKTYSVRAVYSTEGKNVDDAGTPELFNAMRKANAVLADQLAKDLPAP